MTDRRQVKVQAGWAIRHIDVITPPRGTPRYMVLLTRDDEAKGALGFRTPTRCA